MSVMSFSTFIFLSLPENAPTFLFFVKAIFYFVRTFSFKTLQQLFLFLAEELWNASASFRLDFSCQEASVIVTLRCCSLSVLWQINSCITSIFPCFNICSHLYRSHTKLEIQSICLSAFEVDFNRFRNMVSYF